MTKIIKKRRKRFFGIAKGIGSLTKEDKRWMEGYHTGNELY